MLRLQQIKVKSHHNVSSLINTKHRDVFLWCRGLEGGKAREDSRPKQAEGRELARQLALWLCNQPSPNSHEMKKKKGIHSMVLVPLGRACNKAHPPWPSKLWVSELTGGVQRPWRPVLTSTCQLLRQGTRRVNRIHTTLKASFASGADGPVKSPGVDTPGTLSRCQNILKPLAAHLDLVRFC